MSINLESLARLSFKSKTEPVVAAALGILEAENPMTLRQLFYRIVSAGRLANTKSEYGRLGNVMKRLREAGAVPRTWIVDHIRQTLKPSSWSGLADFSETVREAYRKDFWASLDVHVEVFVEKDAVAGTIQPITEKYDIALRVCRGYSSISFAGEIADEWKQIDKPIIAYYLGDYDPSGFDLERDVFEKIKRYGGLRGWPYHGTAADFAEDYDGGDFRVGEICWQRLGVLCEDFDRYDLIRLPAKRTDTRYRQFVAEYGEDCAELDAIPPTELRQRGDAAIQRHIDQDRWEALRRVEKAEIDTLQTVAASLKEATA